MLSSLCLVWPGMHVQVDWKVVLRDAPVSGAMKDERAEYLVIASQRTRRRGGKTVATSKTHLVIPVKILPELKAGD